jgi:hypothetical protein
LSKVRVIREDCDPELAQDRTLPNTAFLVEYEKDGRTCYDIAIPRKKVDMFDYYWDKYRHGLKGWTQTEGRSNPKLWEDPQAKKK